MPQYRRRILAETRGYVPRARTPRTYAIANMTRTPISEIVTRAEQLYGSKVHELADRLRWTNKRTRDLLRGRVAVPISLCAIVPRLTVALGMNRQSVIESVVDLICPDEKNSLGRRIVARLCERGLDSKAIAHRIGVDDGTVMLYINGKNLPGRQASLKLAEWMEMPFDQLIGSINEVKIRSSIQTRDMEEMGDRRSMSDLLMDMVEHSGMKLTAWATSHHLRPATISKIARGGKHILSQETVRKLAGILSVSESQIHAGMRRNVPIPDGPIPAVQLRMRERINNRSFTAASEESGLGMSAITAIMKFADISDLQINSIWMLCRYLGLSMSQFAEMASKRGNDRHTRHSRTGFKTDAPVVEDIEIQMLKAFRRASPKAQTQAMAILWEDLV